MLFYNGSWIWTVASPTRSGLKRSSRNESYWVRFQLLTGKLMSDTKPEYIVLARKYRPQKFSDILGQEDITSVIQAQFNLRVPHAFIFSGTRGVGKTTFARVLAKILNCTDIQENINPCGKCNTCRSIDSDANMDVVEIDAASRTGVIG